MREAQEGREHVQPVIRVERVGPRGVMSGSELGYDHMETMMNWHPSGKQILGFVIMIVGLIAIVAIAIWLFTHQG